MISLNFEINYELLNEKMAEFLDQHSGEINKIIGECFQVVAPETEDKKKVVQETTRREPMVENMPANPGDAFKAMFANK